MIKNYKFIILSGLMILTSCIGDNDSSSFKWNQARASVINSMTSSTQYKISEIMYVNSFQISSKDGYYIKSDKLRGYSETINTNSNYFFSGYSSVSKYIDGNKYAIIANGRTSEKEFDGSSIFDYLGLTSIFSKSINGRTFSSTVSASGISNIISAIKEETGTNANYGLNLFDNEMKYTFNFNNSDALISLELDVTSVMKYFFSDVQQAKRVYYFSSFDESYEMPNYPNLGGNVDENEQSYNEILKSAEDYITSVYSNLKYVSESINFVKSHKYLSRVSYSYSTSNENILKSTGEFIEPDKDEEIVITANIFIDNNFAKSLDFKVTAHKKENRTGELGTISNPIYQGRETIDKVEIYFIEMNQQYGDSIYVKAGDFDMLIDAGQSVDGGNVVKFLRQYAPDCRLDFVVNTHAHGDHIGGMTSVLNWTKYITYALDYGYDKASYATSAVVRNRIKNISDKYIAVTDALEENNGRIYIANDFYIDILDTNQYIKPGVDINGKDDNAASVAFIMTYKNHSYYFAGDLEESGESYLANSNQLKDVDLLKASHHGSPNANYNSLLNNTKPEVVVVSTAMYSKGDKKSNAKDQVHPSAKALNRFYSVGAKVYCNMTMGTVKVVSTGNGELVINGLGVDVPYYLDGSPITGEEMKEFKYTAWANKYR